MDNDNDKMKSENEQELKRKLVDPHLDSPPQKRVAIEEDHLLVKQTDSNENTFKTTEETAGVSSTDSKIEKFAEEVKNDDCKEDSKEINLNQIFKNILLSKIKKPVISTGEKNDSAASSTFVKPSSISSSLKQLAPVEIDSSEEVNVAEADTSLAVESSIKKSGDISPLIAESSNVNTDTSKPIEESVSDNEKTVATLTEPINLDKDENVECTQTNDLVTSPLKNGIKVDVEDHDEPSNVDSSTECIINDETNAVGDNNSENVVTESSETKANEDPAPSFSNISEDNANVQESFEETKSDVNNIPDSSTQEDAGKSDSLDATADKEVICEDKINISESKDEEQKSDIGSKQNDETIASSEISSGIEVPIVSLKENKTEVDVTLDSPTQSLSLVHDAPTENCKISEDSENSLTPNCSTTPLSQDNFEKCVPENAESVCESSTAINSQKEKEIPFDSSSCKNISFSEPLKAIPSEQTAIEVEVADSSTIISVCSGDNTDSLVPTPCDSGETSPSLSTPMGSCQVSAAPSPASKPTDDDQVLSSNIIDDSTLSLKFADEDSKDSMTLEKTISKPGRGRKRKFRPVKKKMDPVIIDEETRMDAESNSNNIESNGNSTGELGMDEDSQNSIGTVNKRKIRTFRSEVIVPASTELFTVDKVAEYVWPLEGMGEHYFIQEHVSQYLGIMSFKRKYPDLRRRPIESQEKEYLKDNGLVDEMACDLGLTAVRSEDVLDVMFNDFPSKYEELQRDLRARKVMQLKEDRVEYQLMSLDKSKLQEYGRKAAEDAARWNTAFNKERREERRYAFDLQTFTVHKPISLCKKLPPEMTQIGSYPVAVLPGQFTDHCRKFTPEDLRCLPLQTVLSGPFTAEELQAEKQPNISDEENTPSSISATSNEKDVTDKENVPVSESVPAEKLAQCKECNGTKEKNKNGKAEPLIICGSCRTASHPTCIELTLAMVSKIDSYNWQCMECKTCAQCNDPDDEERMIFCDMCDRGYHIYCVGLRRVPQGRWHCKECAVCFSCGARTPSGNEHNIKNAEWQHEFKKEKDQKQLKYACTLCVPCDKYWKRRQFCYVCMKVYRSIPEDGMVKCTGCPKYVHREGCSTIHDNERYCTHCFRTRNKTALNHSRIIAAAKKKMASGY